MTDVKVAVTWTDALKVLPARDRLNWQRAITADVAAQAAAPKQGPLSRAYSSGGPNLPPTGLPIVEATVGKRVTGATQQFPSTADLFASTLRDAFEHAKVTFPEMSEKGTDSDSTTDPLVAAIRGASLDAGYRLVVVRALQRRLASDPEWAAEVAARAKEAGTARFPALETVADGSLVAAIAEHNASAITAVTSVAVTSDAVKGGGAAKSAGAGGSGTAVRVEDAMLDAAMDELLDAM